MRGSPIPRELLSPIPSCSFVSRHVHFPGSFRQNTTTSMTIRVRQAESFGRTRFRWIADEGYAQLVRAIQA